MEFDINFCFVFFSRFSSLKTSITNITHDHFALTSRAVFICRMIYALNGITIHFQLVKLVNRHLTGAVGRSYSVYLIKSEYQIG